MTTTPASLVGLGDRLGKVAPGMAGNLVITDGDLFARRTKVLETWVDGRRFEFEKPPVTDARGTWQLEVAGDDGRGLKLTLKITGPARQLTGTLTKVGEEGAEARRNPAQPGYGGRFAAQLPLRRQIAGQRRAGPRLRPRSSAAAMTN